MGVRWNEYLNSWIVTPEEGKKFETKNVLKTLPHRDWVKSAGETISGAATALGEAERVRTEAKREISDKVLASLGKGISFAGQEYLLGLPPGGKYGPWMKHGLTEQEWLKKQEEVRLAEGLDTKTANTTNTTNTTKTTNQETAENKEARDIEKYSGIQNIPTGFKTKAGSKVTRSYTPDQMKEWENKGGDQTPDDYFSRKHLQDSGKNIEWTTDQKTNEGFTFQQNAKTNDELKPKFGADGTMTKNLQIASAVLQGLQKLQPKKEAVNINWSNPYDEDNIRGYTGTWA